MFSDTAASVINEAVFGASALVFEYTDIEKK